jgi:AraC family transcriptional activator of mtrCDE
MDSVSRLVRLARMEGGVDVRCLVAGRFSLDNPAAAPGEVPFHLVVEGHCAVTAGGRTVHMGPGDLVLLPHGGAHRVFAEGRQRRVVEEPGVAFPTRRTQGTEPELDLFCGHYRFDTGAGGLLFRTLPPLLHVSFGSSVDEPARILTTVMRSEAQSGRPGTAAIVSALCDALLAMALRSRPDQRLGVPALWTAMGDDDLGRAIGAVVARPGEHWTIDRLAVDASMSRATFVRRFTVRTGTTVAALVTAIRMMVAAELSRPLSDIGRSPPSGTLSGRRWTRPRPGSAKWPGLLPARDG